MNKSKPTKYFNFYGVGVVVQTDWLEILNLIGKDFYIFEVKNLDKMSHIFRLNIYHANPKKIALPATKITLRTKSSLSYDVGEKRVNDYYGELISKIDFSLDIADLYSQNLHKMHEVAYLIILSRVGKKMDLNGLHKLHAFAVSLNGKALVCMMPSKGGKSTMLLEMLKDPRIKMISDDIPLINSVGNILPFPIKIGLEEFNEQIKVNNPAENIYEMHRTLYGKKILISVAGIEHQAEKVTKEFDQIILIESFRTNEIETKIYKQSWLKTMLGLFRHGIIGFGLPMILEYFWENGITDFIRKTKIFLLRLKAFIKLNNKAIKYKMELGNDPKAAGKQLLKLLDN